MSDTELVIDEITLICKGCQGVRKFPLVPFLRGAGEVKNWLKTKPKACPNCTNGFCDAKMRLVKAS